MNIAINGFGRIGRAIFRIALARRLNVIAINDIHGIKDAAYLLKYDSAYGRFDGKIEYDRDGLKVNGKRVRVFRERNPAQLPWKELKIGTVIESTGAFRDRTGASKHLNAGARRVVLTAPGKGIALTLVPGVNQSKLTRKHDIVSVASCTTNCLAPIVKITHEAFGIENALMTTIHSYTASQGLVDRNHKKPRRGRAAAANIVPTTTGASKAVCDVYPAMHGKINGMAVRVPTLTGSLVDLTARVKKKVDVSKVNKVFEQAAKGKLKGIVEYSQDELVSSDIIGNSHSAVFDSLSTIVNKNFVKVLAWYDNEFGYSSRVVDVIEQMKTWTK